MVEDGIIDSFQVIKTIIEDGISTGALLLTTESVIIKEKHYTRNFLNNLFFLFFFCLSSKIINIQKRTILKFKHIIKTKKEINKKNK